MARKKVRVNPIVGQRIRQLREEKKISQAELANLLQYFQSGNSVLYWEKGRSPVPPDILSELADIFEVSCDYILGKTDNRIAANDSDVSFKNALAIHLSKEQAFRKYMGHLGYEIDIDQFGKLTVTFNKYEVELPDGLLDFKKIDLSKNEYESLCRDIEDYIDFKIDKIADRTSYYSNK